MILEKTTLGYELRDSQFTIFLGGSHSQLPQLKEAYPDFQFARVKQTHSDLVVSTKDASLDYQIVADAHYSQTEKLALCVITADCVPALLYDPTTAIIAAVHAGWRGVAAQILPKTIQNLKSLGANPEQIRVVIGPHIQKDSFEVENHVRDQILDSIHPLDPEENEFYFEATSTTKSKVDLNWVVRRQLQLNGILADHLFNLHIDTFKEPDFHSYRRDKELSGRQISFICMNK